MILCILATYNHPKGAVRNGVTQSNTDYFELTPHRGGMVYELTGDMIQIPKMVVAVTPTSCTHMSITRKTPFFSMFIISSQCGVA